MAVWNTFPLYTADAGADLSGSQFRFVKASTTAAKQVVQTVAGENAIGVLYEPGASGTTVGFANGGILTVYAGGTVAVGAKVASDANGRAVTAASTNHVLGVARTAGVSGQTMEIYWLSAGILA